jgi:hypothetical protein
VASIDKTRTLTGGRTQNSYRCLHKALYSCHIYRLCHYLLLFLYLARPNLQNAPPNIKGPSPAPRNHRSCRKAQARSESTPRRVASTNIPCPPRRDCRPYLRQRTLATARYHSGTMQTPASITRCAKAAKLSYCHNVEPAKTSQHPQGPFR